MIIDANVIISILIESSLSKTNFIKENRFQAPNFLKIELINVLRKYHFISNLSLENARQYYENGKALVDEFYDESEILTHAIEISFSLNHPIYDCIYLALAKYLNVPFVSIDKKLLDKANTIGIEVFDFGNI